MNVPSFKDLCQDPKLSVEWMLKLPDVAEHTKTLHSEFMASPPSPAQADAWNETMNVLRYLTGVRIGWDAAIAEYHRRLKDEYTVEPTK